MKVKELIKKLEKEDKNKEIYLACDSEGNNFFTIDNLYTIYDKLVIYPTDTYLDFSNIEIEHSIKKYLAYAIDKNCKDMFVRGFDTLKEIKEYIKKEKMTLLEMDYTKIEIRIPIKDKQYLYKTVKLLNY